MHASVQVHKDVLTACNAEPCSSVSGMLYPEHSCNICCCRDEYHNSAERGADANSQHVDGAASNAESSTTSSSSEDDSDYDSCEDSAVNSSAVTVNCERVTWQRQSSSTASTNAYAYRYF